MPFSYSELIKHQKKLNPHRNFTPPKLTENVIGNVKFLTTLFLFWKENIFA